jgi:lysophospholipase L1-like esterase
MRVFFVGDSITQGYWDLEGGWVTRISKGFTEQAIDDSPYYESPRVFNLGVSGDNADKILKRLDVELRARIDGRDDVVIFSFGTNDSQKRNGQVVSSPEKFKKDLEKIYQIAKKYVDGVAIANILPCDEARVQPVAWNAEVYYYNERINDFNQVIGRFCKEKSVRLIDIATPFATANTDNQLLIDGLHPNSDGHKLIAEIVLKGLEEILQ